MEIQRSLSLLLLFALFSSSLSFSRAYNFYVGGRDGWVLNPSESYSHWAERNRFQVNDTLYFKYKKGANSVLVVNKLDYEKCNKKNPIEKLEGGDSEFKFGRSGPFFFISGTHDYCEKGQKLIIVVLAVRPQKILPPPKSSPSPPSHPPSPSAHPPSPVAWSPSPGVETPSVSPPSPSPSAKTPTSSPAPAGWPKAPSPSEGIVPTTAPVPAGSPTWSSPAPSLAPVPKGPAASPVPATMPRAPSPRTQSPSPAEGREPTEAPVPAGSPTWTSPAPSSEGPAASPVPVIGPPAPSPAISTPVLSPVFSPPSPPSLSPTSPLPPAELTPSPTESGQSPTGSGGSANVTTPAPSKAWAVRRSGRLVFTAVTVMSGIVINMLIGLT